MNPKRQAFVREYMVDLNATQAAIRAGYSDHAGSARVTGCRLLADPNIAAEIAAAQQKKAKELDIDAMWVLKRLLAEATADISEIHDADGNLLPMSEWPMVWRTGLVAGFETATERSYDKDAGPTVIRKVKLTDRTRLLELIGKHVNIGAFKDRLEVDVNGIGDLFRKAEERLKGGK